MNNCKGITFSKTKKNNNKYCGICVLSHTMLTENFISSFKKTGFLWGFCSIYRKQEETSKLLA